MTNEMSSILQEQSELETGKSKQANDVRIEKPILGVYLLQHAQSGTSGTMAQ